MNHEINKLVTTGNKVGVVVEEYGDLYRIAFFNDNGELVDSNYGYYLEEEVDAEVNKRLIGRLLKKWLRDL